MPADYAIQNISENYRPITIYVFPFVVAARYDVFRLD